MNLPRMSALARFRPQPLAACVTLSFSLAAAAPCVAAVQGVPSEPGHPSRAIANAHTAAGALPVTNCNDSGAGSLREAIAAAVSADTIDLQTLGCSTITLTSGAIDIAQAGLTLSGPGAASLTIDAGAQSGVLRHAGSGTLIISGLAFAHGEYQSADSPRGGCLYSAGNIELTGSLLSYCAAVGTSDAVALGGAIYTHGDLSLLHTQVADSHAQGTASGAHGGGVYVHGNLTAIDSAISRNAAYGAPINGGEAGGVMVLGTTMLKRTTIADNGSFSVGGLYTLGEVTIEASTISGNSASHSAGMRAIATTGSPTATITNSTITGNHAFATVGGINLIIPAVISNSTIAFNEANNGLAGVLMSGPTLQLDSTIIAGNLGSQVPDDFAVFGSPLITGGNNLVVASTATLPPDTLQSDPLLGELSDNGGPTQTIPLLDGSPAIDGGNNNAQPATDQRGLGFPRVVGAAADIGAFEVQDGDVIYANGFEAP